MSEKKLQTALVGSFVAIIISVLALGVAYRVSIVPWRTLAEAQTTVVAFKELQLQQLQTLAQQAVTTALRDEKARFSDLFKILEKYDEETVAYLESNGGIPEGQLADAIDRAQSRITEWRSEGR